MTKSLFEKLGGRYELQGDYLIPCLTVPAEEEQSIGIWGQRHLDYLKQYRKVTYTNLLTSGKFNTYLADIVLLFERIRKKNSMCKRKVELKDTQLKKKVNNSSVEKTLKHCILMAGGEKMDAKKNGSFYSSMQKTTWNDSIRFSK